MNKPCNQCDDTGWVCENHVALPWSGCSERGNACKCGGAGMPCTLCNPCDYDNPPDMSRAMKVKLDKDGWRH